MPRSEGISAMSLLTDYNRALESQNETSCLASRESMLMIYNILEQSCKLFFSGV